MTRWEGLRSDNGLERVQSAYRHRMEAKAKARAEYEAQVNEQSKRNRLIINVLSKASFEQEEEYIKFIGGSFGIDDQLILAKLIELGFELKLENDSCWIAVSQSDKAVFMYSKDKQECVYVVFNSIEAMREELKVVGIKLELAATLSQAKLKEILATTLKAQKAVCSGVKSYRVVKRYWDSLSRVRVREIAERG
ncbi:hypothetical protein U472_09760 [Orenia metallireducens]|uniref:Uncharacterized protein n=1 Tax=Orenia metallireducens TaxID=1413210 RepID=A0A1C0A7S5_9FIRM|nr:hypothetical protein [Orenia metallireducens]OCL26287.1 hypothetical protein U472_09760 [Orenia metallireducens]